MAASSKKASLFISLLLLLLLVAAVHGDEAQHAADAMDTAGAGDGGERRVTTVRTGHGHGYSSSHSGGHTGGGGGSGAEKGGAGVVDPRNLNARSHRSGAAAASRGRAALGYSSAVVCGLAGAALAVVALP